MELSREQILKYLKLRLLYKRNQPTPTEDTIQALELQQLHALERKSQFLFAFTNSFSVTSASRKAGISRETYYRWIDEDPMFKEMVEEVKEMKIDFFEDALIKTVKEKGQGYARLIEFALKTIGKSRGYTEEVTSYEDDVVDFSLNLGRTLKAKDEE